MADDPCIEPLMTYLAEQDSADPVGDLGPAARRYYTEQAEAVVALADRNDPLRVLLADEDRARALITRNTLAAGASMLHARAASARVLAALREVAGL